MNATVRKKPNKSGLKFEDASASSFGWDFQANAGLYLFIKQIKTAKSVKIETRHQDIVIAFNDETFHYIQAKSARDFNDTTNSVVKIKDALVSLVKTPAAENDKLIYATNIHTPLLNDSEIFKNKLQWFNDCPSNIKDEIEKRFGEIVSKVNNEIADSSISNKRKKNLEAIKENLEKFCFDNFGIIVLYPYNTNPDNRYSMIKDEIIKMLSDMQFSSVDANLVVNKLLTHWQNLFRANSTISDLKNFNKSITKAEFVWPVVIFLSNFDIDKVSPLLSFTADDDLENRVKIYLEESWIYHERFEFLSKILKSFNDYKKRFVRQNNLSVNDEFIKNEWKLFEQEFITAVNDDNFREFVTKVFLHKIIKNYSNHVNVASGVRL